MNRNPVFFIVALTALFVTPAMAARIIKITPAQGACNTTITITGSGFTNGNTVNVSYDGCNSAEKVAISGGAFTATIDANCDKASTNGIQAHEYNKNDDFIAKSNRLDFKQTTGCKSKEFRTTALSVETRDNRALFINHNSLGTVLSRGEDSTCLAALTGAAKPAECGNLRILDWGGTGWREDAEHVKYLITTGTFDQNPMLSMQWRVESDHSFTNAGKVNPQRTLADNPHFIRVGGAEGHDLKPQAAPAKPDIYFTARTSTSVLFLEAAFNSQIGKFVAPFKTLLTIPKGSAISAYSSSTGDIVGFIRPIVGGVESLHRVGSKTGTTTIARANNIFAVNMDITRLIPDLTPAPELTGRRLAAYSVMVQNGSAFTKGIYTQMFDSKGEALTPRGPARLIQPFAPTSLNLVAAERLFRNVAIADDGSFVVYATNNPACNKLTVWFQKLNPVSGAKFGPRKALVDCAAVSASTLGAHAVDVIQTR
jgi:hypothetical protein